MRLPPIASPLILLATAIAAPAQDIFVTPIPGVPFSGLVQVERSSVQPDGSVRSFKTIRAIARDSRGRIHNEARMLVPASSAQTPKILRIHLYDPQTRISTMLDPQERTFSSMIVNRPPATTPPALKVSPAGTSLPPNEFTKEEDLGMRDIDGVQVHGVRDIQTIPIENGDTGKEVAITDEYWYSDDLRINMVVKHSDPRTASVTLTVGQVVRTEPDSALFEIPAGYRRAGEGGNH